MKIIFVVDVDAVGISGDLNTIAKSEGIDFKFIPFSSPDRMFKECKKTMPDLILAHHNWVGLTITQLLQRLVDETRTARVVVFTGRPINIGELIECVRFGVADYWTTRTLNATETVRKVSTYCSSGLWTLESLRRPSGTLVQLLQKAETAGDDIAALQQQNQELRAQLHASDAANAVGILSAKYAVIKIASYITVLTIAAAVLKLVGIPTDAEIWIMVILTLFCLFAEGRLAEAAVKIKGFTGHFRGPK